MAANPIDILENLLQRIHGLAPTLGTDGANIDKQSYDVMVLTLLVSSVTLRIIQQLAPTITDTVLSAQFDAALNTSPGQSWDEVTKRTCVLGTDPNNNPWMG